MIVTEFHRRIYIFRARHSLLDHAHRFEPERDPEARRREARHVADDDGLLLHPRRDRAHRLDGFAGSLSPDDYLYEPHDVYGVEEVHADDARRRARAFCDFGYR